MDTNQTKVYYRDCQHSQVVLSDEFRTGIKDLLIKKYNLSLVTPLAKKIGVEPATLSRLFNGGQIEVHTLERIRKHIGLDNHGVEGAIRYIDSAPLASLPINFDCVEGVRIDAGIFNEGRVRKRCAEYTNKDEALLDLIRRCAKRLVSSDFEPKSWFDSRMGTTTLSFPAFFAKHYVKLGFVNSSDKNLLGIPQYVKDGPEEYWKTWLRATISEDGCIYPLVHNTKRSGFYLYPRIQINRTVEIHADVVGTKGTNVYKNNLPETLVYDLQTKPHKLLSDEAVLFSRFGVNVDVGFSRLHISNNSKITAAYSLIICSETDFTSVLDNIGFEFDNQFAQAKLLLENHGPITKDRLRDIIHKFYSLTPVYLRDKKKIKHNEWLESEQKTTLIGVENAEITHNRGPWTLSNSDVA